MGKELMKQIGKHFPSAQRIKCAGQVGDGARRRGRQEHDVLFFLTDETASTIYTVLTIFVARIDRQQDDFFVACVLWLCFLLKTSRPVTPAK